METRIRKHGPSNLRGTVEVKCPICGLWCADDNGKIGAHAWMSLGDLGMKVCKGGGMPIVR